MSKPKLSALFVAIAASVTLLLGGAPAQAAPDRNCYAGEFCAYKDMSYSQDAPVVKWTQADGNWAWHAWAVYEDDSSWINNWNVPAKVYDDTNYGGGATICIPAHNRVYYNEDANDDGASHKWDGNNC